MHDEEYGSDLHEDDVRDVDYECDCPDDLDYEDLLDGGHCDRDNDPNDPSVPYPKPAGDSDGTDFSWVGGALLVSLVIMVVRWLSC